MLGLEKNTLPTAASTASTAMSNPLQANTNCDAVTKAVHPLNMAAMIS